MIPIDQVRERGGQLRRNPAVDLGRYIVQAVALWIRNRRHAEQVIRRRTTRIREVRPKSSRTCRATVPIVDGRTLGCWWGRTRTGPGREHADPWRRLALDGRGGSAEKVAAVLRERGLSIHYVIDADGRTVQMADPADTVCYHAGSRANAQFIGVEIVNRGVAPSLPKRNRPRVDATVRGRKVHALAFTRAASAVAELADRLIGGPWHSEGSRVRNVKPAGPGAVQGHLEHLPQRPEGGLLRANRHAPWEAFRWNLTLTDTSDLARHVRRPRARPWIGRSGA